MHTLTQFGTSGGRIRVEGEIMPDRVTFAGPRRAPAGPWKRPESDAR